MTRRTFRTIVFTSLAPVVMLGAACQARAQDAKTPYPSMAPLEQYLMEPKAEIALARSAAPNSISQDAEVMVLGRDGYKTAVKGKNGFVCAVERSWTAGPEDPNFWNPKLRGAICYNAAAAGSYFPLISKRTEVILATRSKEKMTEAMEAALGKKELPPLETGAMAYMMSKEQYLGDSAKHWHPHVMFFLPPTDAAAWGAGSAGSPVIEIKDTVDRLTVFLIPVGEWSDGSAAPKMEY